MLYQSFRTRNLICMNSNQYLCGDYLIWLHRNDGTQRHNEGMDILCVQVVSSNSIGHGVIGKDLENKVT